MAARGPLLKARVEVQVFPTSMVNMVLRSVAQRHAGARGRGAGCLRFCVGSLTLASTPRDREGNSADERHLAVGPRVVRWKRQGVITKPTRPERGRERSSLSSCRSRPWCRWASSPSPWALPASAWAGFITHSRARCEIGSIAPARFAPIREQPCATQHTACTGGGDPPLAPPPLVRQLATVAPAAALPYPPSELSARVCIRPPIRLPSDARRR